MALSAASAASRALAALTDTKAWSLGSRRSMRVRHSSTRSTGESRRAAMSAANVCTGRRAGDVMAWLLERMRVTGCSPSDRPREAEFVSVRIDDVEVALAP